MASNPNLARLDALEASTDDLRVELDQLQERLVQDPCHQRWHIGDQTPESAPVWTERVNLDSTVKDGFRVKEATVTVANAKGDDATREERRRRLAELIEDGEMVAAEKNHEREQTKRFA